MKMQKKRKRKPKASLEETLNAEDTSGMQHRPPAPDQHVTVLDKLAHPSMSRKSRETRNDYPPHLLVNEGGRSIDSIGGRMYVSGVDSTGVRTSADANRSPDHLHRSTGDSPDGPRQPQYAVEHIMQPKQMHHVDSRKASQGIGIADLKSYNSSEVPFNQDESPSVRLPMEVKTNQAQLLSNARLRGKGKSNCCDRFEERSR